MKKGVVTFNKGFIYAGERDEQGRKSGRGFYVAKDGSLYEGYFQADKLHGRGREINKFGEVYDGEWRESTRHGFGRFTYCDGTFYEGNW